MKLFLSSVACAMGAAWLAFAAALVIRFFQNRKSK
ncbi:hypothetical protein J2W34_000089 [Variovorax boronicumulans]|nr:hypothetical protein [Variovorax boronicumulans]